MGRISGGGLQVYQGCRIQNSCVVCSGGSPAGRELRIARTEGVELSLKENVTYLVESLKKKRKKEKDLDERHRLKIKTQELIWLRDQL